MDYDETGLRTIIPEEPDVTSPNTGLRRTALAILAVGATFGATACSAGQVSQTANQVAAVDGGQGSAGDVHLNDLQVVLPEDDGEARVGFAASFTGSGFGDTITLDNLEIDGNQVELGEFPPLERGCTVISSAAEDADTGSAQEGICLDQITATLPSAEGLNIAQAAPATATFSNGDVIETEAGVVAEYVDEDYTRPTPTDIPTEGH